MTSRPTSSQTSKYSAQSLEPHVVIIGSGFTGLAAAYDLTHQGVRVTVLEADSQVGGLAGSFDVDGVSLEKFYHHWFNNDEHVMDLIDELGARDNVLLRKTRTGTFYANNFFKMSSPLDLLRFKPLKLIDRIRLGLFVLKARKVKNWKDLEGLSAEQWLRSLCGEEVFRVMWEPLLRGKFGPFSSDVSAVWIWNKLKLRGGSRAKDGGEELAYYKGGFAALADKIAENIEACGGKILTSTPVQDLIVQNGRCLGVRTPTEDIVGDCVLATPSLPIVAKLVQDHVASDYVEKIRSIDYLANVCLVLQLDRSLSDLYWCNVNDPEFPYVGIIEHTNFEPPETYGGKHLVYLSKYLPADAPLYQMTETEAFEFSIPYIQRMFPQFDRSWVLKYHVWKARYSQPIVTKHYSRIIPKVQTPLGGLFLSTMAQIYPEDRGTNYAIREGRSVANVIAQSLPQAKPKVNRAA